MDTLMPDWAGNPHSGFVFAAYAIALILLVSLGLSSWYDYRQRAKEWDVLAVKRRNKENN